jgi:hypothetical protein
VRTSFCNCTCKERGQRFGSVLMSVGARQGLSTSRQLFAEHTITTKSPYRARECVTILRRYGDRRSRSLRESFGLARRGHNHRPASSAEVIEPRRNELLQYGISSERHKKRV